MKYNIPLGYKSKLSKQDTHNGISEIRTGLVSFLKKEMKLTKAYPGLISEKNLWLNDDFQYTERAIEFDTKNDFFAELNSSANKWRRFYLYKTELVKPNTGILTEFTTVRRDVNIGHINSLVYDEIGFDIVKEVLVEDEIRDTCIKIYKSIAEVDLKVSAKHFELNNSHFKEQLSFISYRKLKMMYPFLSYNERLNRFGKEYGAFVLTNFVNDLVGQKDVTKYSEDVFNFDYFVKIYVYNQTIEKSISIGYLSYQVDKETLKKQNLMLKENWKSKTNYNHLIKTEVLPLTLSAGINTNRIVMTILEKVHIGEVHSSVWENNFMEYCEKNDINIL